MACIDLNCELSAPLLNQDFEKVREAAVIGTCCSFSGCLQQRVNADCDGRSFDLLTLRHKGTLK
jgi:hypothetical protein